MLNSFSRIGLIGWEREVFISIQILMSGCKTSWFFDDGILKIAFTPFCCRNPRYDYLTYRLKTSNGFSRKSEGRYISKHFIPTQISRDRGGSLNLCTASPDSCRHEIGLFLERRKDILNKFDNEVIRFYSVHVTSGQYGWRILWDSWCYQFYGLFLLIWRKSTLVFIQEANRSFYWRANKRV